MWMINDFLVTLSYPVGARPAILLVLVMQRIAYLNGCTNQKICYMGHERFREEPPPPPPTVQDVFSSGDSLKCHIRSEL